MLKIIGLIIVVAFVAVLVYAATKPDSFRVARSITIKAPPERIFALINRLQSWTTWSPYEKLDPALNRNFSGPEQGVGAVYAWEGNSKAGVGSMEIIESAPSSKVAIKLDFVKPFSAHNIATFSLQPDGDSTLVTWAMDGPSPYFMKIMGTFVNLDHLIGRDFEAGLATLKTMNEQQPAVAPPL